jgi:hypothetical protein
VYPAVDERDAAHALSVPAHRLGKCVFARRARRSRLAERSEADLSLSGTKLAKEVS